MRKPRVATAATVVTAGLLLLSTAPTGSVAGAQSADPTAAYDLYFGDLHAHTNYSDGAGTPWTAFAAAKAAGADFFATTDHVAYPYGQVGLTPALWDDTLDAAEASTDEGFVALAGYELWLPETGELNVFATDEVYGQAGNPGGRGFDNGLHTSVRKALPRLYDWLADTGAIGQWNHPWTFGNGVGTTPLEEFFNFGYRTTSRDRGIALIEAYNGGSYEDAYVRALDAGWHVMPAANSDTHSADWISGSEVRTVLLAEDLTASDLYDAMRNHRGYATQDSNLAVRFGVNGSPVGSTLAPATTYALDVRIADPDGAGDAITRVEILSDGGGVVASVEPNATDVHWTPTLSSSTARYFFVRISTASDAEGNPGVTAWTAPVWTGR
jgi:hypothetical protein